MTETVHRTHYRVTFAVLLLGTIAYALLQSLVLPVLPTIQHSLHTSQANVTWVLTAYLLSASIATPILGRFGDMVGKQHMLVITLSALALGSVLAGLSNSIGLLIVARAIQGIGGAVLPLAFGIIRDEFPALKVAGGVGIVAAMAAVGAGAGIVLAGPIVEHLNFHWLFWIPLVICVIAVVCAKLFVPESPVRAPGRVSWPAALLLSGWLVALLLAVSEAPTWGWGSASVIGLLALAIVLIVAWIYVELRSRYPLVDMHMMQVRAVWTNNLVAFLFGVGMYAVLGFLPEFLQTPKSSGYGFGASIIQSGLYLLPLTVTMFVFGLLSGKISAKVGSKSAVIAGSMASTAAYLVLAFAHHQSWEIYLASTLLGVGLGLAFSAMSNLIVQAVPAAQTGVASGMNANIRTIGGAIGAGVMSSIVTSQLLRSGLPAESGYTRGFAFLAIMSALAIVAAVFIPTAVPLAAGEDLEHNMHTEHAELALVPGGALTE
jgi:EmrB/QacA subfamily drug resistance transporter